MTAQHQAEALALARRVGSADAAFDTAHKYGLSAADARVIRDAIQATLENEAREQFRARVRHGGMRHVGNSGRV
ncbi:hypothetical protein EJP67_32890 [Variovorax guangxiensis]|uniref:Uncharacterized protein n=1 Tax=Variovorax guangxiensis TaxID=1775474 RepID=A0A3S0ZTE6_9BURK|nr:hypothetical protein [Variovorax guangxiensis]RUR71854.1 hypothetical protein EJP67_32890 [Variovorax guangxiensis]